MLFVLNLVGCCVAALFVGIVLDLCLLFAWGCVCCICLLVRGCGLVVIGCVLTGVVV